MSDKLIDAPALVDGREFEQPTGQQAAVTYLSLENFLDSAWLTQDRSLYAGNPLSAFRGLIPPKSLHRSSSALVEGPHPAWCSRHGGDPFHNPQPLTPNPQPLAPNP